MDIYQKIMTFLSPRTKSNPYGCGPQKQSMISFYIRERRDETIFALIKLVSLDLVKQIDQTDDPIWALTTAGRQGMGSLTLDMRIGQPPLEDDKFIRVVDPDADVPVTYVRKEKPEKEVSPIISDFDEWRKDRQIAQTKLKATEKLSERRVNPRGNNEKTADKADSPHKQLKPKNKPNKGK